ncbi:hypothetical protein NIES4101_25130 (plasmid) [Calothrix sp. NIES-4101]|nr:hypothetical protein NIES4101_25130 [Calothrix sp. NIES-4101]
MKVRKVIEIEVVGLGSRIRQVREADSRSLAEICRQIPMSTMIAPNSKVQVRTSEFPIPPTFLESTVMGM